MRKVTGLMATLFMLFAANTQAQGPPEHCARDLHVRDEDGQAVLIFPEDASGTPFTVDLSGTQAASWDPTAIALSSLEGDHVSFVTQGQYVHVVDDWEGTPFRTLDVAYEIGVSSLALQGVSAGKGGRLYLVGSRPNGSFVEPYLVVLDESDVITQNFGNVTVLHHGPVCVTGVNCVGTAVDVEASLETTHEAYVSVLNDETNGSKTQRFYRVAEIAGNWDVTLDAANADVAWSGVAHRHIGLDYGLDDAPFGVFQTGQIVGNLLDGSKTCSLGGFPLDIEAWGPMPGVLNHDSYHLVLFRDASGDSRIVIYPAMSCPGTAPETVTLTVGANATALTISRRTETSFYAYTANATGLTRLEVEIETDGEQDTVVVTSSDIPLDGRPIDVAFRRTEPEPNCISAPKDPTDEHCPDDDDPHCINPRPVDVAPPPDPPECSGRQCILE